MVCSSIATLQQISRDFIVGNLHLFDLDSLPHPLLALLCDGLTRGAASRLIWRDHELRSLVNPQLEVLDLSDAPESVTERLFDASFIRERCAGLVQVVLKNCSTLVGSGAIVERLTHALKW